MPHIYPDELTKRVETAIKEMTKKGHKLISGDWLSYHSGDGTFCGCALGLTLLHEKGEEEAAKVARVRYRGAAIDHFAEQLNITSLEVQAFVAGFDREKISPGSSEHERDIYEAGEAMRSFLSWRLP